MKKLLAALLLTAAGVAQAQALPVREQARIVNDILAERLDILLPALMKKNDIDMWVLISREYNEDPVLKTMLPAEWLNARRRTILVFYQNPKTSKYEKLAIARYDVGTAIKGAWDLKRFPDQWDALADLIKTRMPNRIGINTSAAYGHADGMDQTDYAEFMRTLPADYKNKVVSAEKLAVMWLESRTEREMQLYPQLVNATHKIIATGFSEQVITPGVTTTEDVEWWFRQKIRDSGYDTWFHPTVSLQRKDTAEAKNFAVRPKSNVIVPGDLLHVDIGISYLRLNTDVQQHAYVLKPGEKDIPASLRAAFANGNRLQDILTSQFKQGRSGNEILAAALAQAKSERINATIYTHPLGMHGHAAGPTIGMWDMQGGVPGSGEFPMHYKTAYSIELNAESTVPEWGKKIRVMLEEDGYFDESGFRYIDGRQRQIYPIPRSTGQIGE
ncbi:M24 family metallopeptidase [Massilia sp. GCM10020059]|uniref:Aminopeptidase P family protein n=1 Tax=Massilia agrisoli TaxID=2892444 RepID=A0ABS8IWE3_9BURK|nr:M24 family metallopeptidase [Massilia agrisoli]MCC6072810.1 aminopeptidase P family protein [Massilia agrisoli]